MTSFSSQMISEVNLYKFCFKNLKIFCFKLQNFLLILIFKEIYLTIPLEKLSSLKISMMHPEENIFRHIIMHQNACIKFSQSASSITFTPPFHQKLPYDFWTSFIRKLHTLESWKEWKFSRIYIFLVHSTCKYAEKFFLNFFFSFRRCCTSQCHEICWWVCKLHMFWTKKFVSPICENEKRKKKKKKEKLFFVTYLPFFVYTYACIVIIIARYYKKISFFSCFSQLFFSSIPFSLVTLSRLVWERKIRGERGALSI